MMKRIKVHNAVGNIEKSVTVNPNCIPDYAQLEKGITIPKNASICLNGNGHSITFHSDSVSILIGIGNSNTAELIMTVDAWEALKNGHKVSIDKVPLKRKKVA